MVQNTGPRIVVSGRLGFILLGLWALLTAVLGLFGLKFELEPLILNLILGVAGFLILFGV